MDLFFKFKKKRMERIKLILIIFMMTNKYITNLLIIFIQNN